MVDLGTVWMVSLIKHKVLELMHVLYPLCKCNMRFVACD